MTAVENQGSVRPPNRNAPNLKISQALFAILSGSFSRLLLPDTPRLKENMRELSLIGDLGRPIVDLHVTRWGQAIL
jgi:hypothetical protein